MAAANARMICSLAAAGMAGSPTMTDLAPPCGNPAAAFINVMARASRTHSPTLTSGAMRVPPIAGPAAVLSITTIAFKPSDGC